MNGQLTPRGVAVGQGRGIGPPGGGPVRAFPSLGALAGAVFGPEGISGSGGGGTSGDLEAGIYTDRKADY